MNNSLLANLRWLCLPSDNLGADWFQKSGQIDSCLEAEGFDLSEESVYLLFSDSPDRILEGVGQCLIARPVIGPLKEVKAPFKLIDWKAAPVWQETLSGATLDEILTNAQAEKTNAVKGTRDFEKSFYLRVKRTLKGELNLSVEGIFHE
jgi:hypothetical protein